MSPSHLKLTVLSGTDQRSIIHVGDLIIVSSDSVDREVPEHVRQRLATERCVVTKGGFLVYRMPVRSSDDLIAPPKRDLTPVHIVGHTTYLAKSVASSLPVSFRHPFEFCVYCQHNRIPIYSMGSATSHLATLTNEPWGTLNRSSWAFVEPEKIIKIFGERRTGTNALARTIGSNFNLQIAGYGYFGWKHRCAPSAEEIDRFAKKHTFFVITTRHPITWAFSMFHNPFHFRVPGTFEQFLDSTVYDSQDDGFPGSYPNPMTLWNEKNGSYCKLLEEGPTSLVRLEDFTLDTSSTLRNLATFFDEPPPVSPTTFQNKIDETGNLTDRSVNKNLLDPSMLALSSHAKKRIIDTVDWSVAERLGYSEENPALRLR